MAASSSLSRLAASSSHHPFSYSCCNRRPKLFTVRESLSKGLFNGQPLYLPQLNSVKVLHKFDKSTYLQRMILEAKRTIPKAQTYPFAITEDESSDNEFTSDASEQHKQHLDVEDLLPENYLTPHSEGTIGKPGFISFYGSSHEKKMEILELSLNKNQSNLIWFLGPSVLAASFIFPSLYLRGILSFVFEDSLLTDFLILFFSEALIYCGFAIFFLLFDRLQRPLELTSPKSISVTTQLIHHISYAVTLVFSLIISMATMGMVWPWIGPAAPATLAPYLVGIVMQFAFEQYAKYVKKSPSWPVIPIVFQVYRLHQLNRAALLVTDLSFAVKGAMWTSHNMTIGSSLAKLSNVLQVLGLICIWSLSSFLMRMRFLPSGTRSE